MHKIDELTLEFSVMQTEERKRTYIFPQGSVTIENVASVCVRPSGGHRLETGEGLKFVIAPGWMAIEIDAEQWSF